VVHPGGGTDEVRERTRTREPVATPGRSTATPPEVIRRGRWATRLRTGSVEAAATVSRRRRSRGLIPSEDGDSPDRRRRCPHRAGDALLRVGGTQKPETRHGGLPRQDARRVPGRTVGTRNSSGRTGRSVSYHSGYPEVGLHSSEVSCGCNDAMRSALAGAQLAKGTRRCDDACSRLERQPSSSGPRAARDPRMPGSSGTNLRSHHFA
jgi:hypothetical protein